MVRLQLSQRSLAKRLSMINAGAPIRSNFLGRCALEMRQFMLYPHTASHGLLPLSPEHTQRTTFARLTSNTHSARTGRNETRFFREVMAPANDSVFHFNANPNPACIGGATSAVGSHGRSVAARTGGVTQWFCRIFQQRKILKAHSPAPRQPLLLL